MTNVIDMFKAQMQIRNVNVKLEKERKEHNERILREMKS